MKRNTFTAIAITTLLFSMSLSELSAQDLQVSYFGHAGYTAKFNHQSNTPDQNAFNSGGLDILLSSQISDRFSAIGELFSGYRGDGANSVILSIERLNFKYSFNDYFNVRLGRMYTPLSFWQARYSQAQFFQPTINAPYAVRTKYDKGLLPTNSVGVQVEGENIGKLRFSYYLMLDNSSGAPSLNTDNTDFKAVTGKVKIEPIENLEIYTSARYDEMAKGSLTLQGKPVDNQNNQNIYNAGLVHIAQGAKFEYALEYFHVTNQAKDTAATENDLMYAYLGYKIKKFVPYAQYDFLSFASRENYFLKDDLAGLIIGARYSIAPSAVIKLEYKYRTNQIIDHQDVISIQIAARF